MIKLINKNNKNMVSGDKTFIKDSYDCHISKNKENLNKFDCFPFIANIQSKCIQMYIRMLIIVK